MLYLYTVKTTETMTSAIYKMESTGIYDEAKIAKFHARQMKLNNGNREIADAIVRMYKHTFLIRKKTAA